MTITDNSQRYEPRDPPKYDWHYFLDCEDGLNADTLIKWLKEPRKINSATRFHGRGLDLSHLRDELAMLLAEVHEQYETDRDEWHQRNGPEVAWHTIEEEQRKAEEEQQASEDVDAPYAAPLRPARKLSGNWKPGVPGEPASPYDYSAHEKPLTKAEHAAEWAAWWQEAYARDPGRPKKSKTRRELATGPMDGPYFTIQSWWKRHVKRGFNPDYNFGKKSTAGTVDRKDWEYFNQAGRLLLMIAQDLDYRYTPTICNSLNHRLRKSRWSKSAKQ